MKVDTTRLKKGTSELTLECRQLIEDMTARKSRQELLHYLETLRGWVYGKCELYHWIEILDRFDDILSEASKENPDNEFSLYCDTNYAPSDVRLLLYVINFTTLLIEHSFSRHLYNSIEYLTQLLSSTNMDVIMCVLNLLYMFSKRSNFIPRLSSIKKISLLTKLYNFAESWGGKENGFSLAQCCKEEARLPVSSSTLYFEYYNTGGRLDYIEVPGLDKMSESAAIIAKMHILTRIRLAATFRNYRMRLQFVQARLQAISVLVYSNALQDNIHTLLYPGFLDELVELLEIKDIHLVEIRAAALRTLTSIIHLDRNPNFPKKPGSRLSKIIEVTGAALYHGFLPTLVRSCINHLISIQTKDLDLAVACSVIHQCTYAYRNPNSSTRFDTSKEANQFPLSLATALFSFLYHLASYEAGGEALVSCGMMESLLRVINWPGVDLEHITFVTRAVRVIDLITNIDMHSFHSYNGLRAFIQRLEVEVNHCRQFQITMREKTNRKKRSTINVDKFENLRNFDGEDGEDFDVIDLESAESIDRYENDDSNYSFDSENHSHTQLTNESSTSSCNRNASNSTTRDKEKKITCVTQRAALLKSMLNFLKKSIQDSAYNSGMRNIMESSLPRSLRNIVSNAEYYGPSLFLLATDVITVYVFQEPSLLSTLQESGLTDIVLQSLLRKEVPATREVLGSLPNVFSALCLNARGLEEFSSYKPFDRLFQVLLSPAYLVAMRRRRSSDPLGDTATNLGNAMDDLIKHHPSLRTDATQSIIKLLIELVRIGSDPHYICWRANNNGKSDSSLRLQSESISRNQNKDAGNGSSCDDDDDEEIATASQQRNDRSRTAAVPNLTSSGASAHSSNRTITITTPEEREPVPLIDYILNVMKFLDAIISNGTNGEHCREFVSLGGLQPLLSILSLPNLPVDSPVTTTAQAVATVCKSILNQTHETKVIEVAIVQLSNIVEQLNPLIIHMNSPEGSILLRELTNCPKKEAGFSNAAYTPLLHSMSAVHGYVVMLVHICRSSQNDIRILLLRKWGFDCIRGKKLLQSLVQLYASLVWESTILLGMCSDENSSKDVDFSYDGVTRVQSIETDIDEEFPEQSNSETFTLLSATTSASLSAPSIASTVEANIAATCSSTSQPRSTRASDSRFVTNFPSTFGLVTASTSTMAHEILPQRSANSMEIDDDVVCLTPLPTDNNVSQSNACEEDSNIITTVETISIDSATSSSSDSVVYVPPISEEEQETQKKNEKDVEQKKINANETDGNRSSRQQSSEEAYDETKRRERGAVNQIRYIKALLAASSRLGRALAELFGNLVKLCVGSPSRQRRPNELLSASKFPYTEAGDIARVLSYILVNGFCYDKIVSPGAPKLKLTFLICSVGFTGPMLFDEKRYAFHLMLSQFCEEGGLEAFFDMFRWALTYGCPGEDKDEFMKGNEYAEGTGEFLDAWLLLLEKMVNPRAIFESPHYVTSQPLSGPSTQLLDFEPVFYMVKIHSLALKALCDIWDKKPLPNYGIRMAESIMAIIKHIVKNESMLREKFIRRKAELKKLEESRQVYRDSVKKTVNFNHLQLFMDMGFSEMHVSEALANTNSVEQATDFLLNRPESDRNPIVLPSLGVAENDYDDDDDEDEDDEDDDDEDSDDRNGSGHAAAQPRHSRCSQSPPPPQSTQNAYTESRNKITWKSVQLPDLATIDNFCREAFDKTFNTMDHLPETVISGADLLAVLYRHHNSDMKQKFVLTLVQNITDWTEKILHNLKARDALNSVKREEILIGRYGMKMFIRLKIGCLLLDEIYRDMRKSFCTAIRHEKSLSTLIMLLHKIESILQEQITLGAPPLTPRWLQHLIEFIDSIENSCLIMQRKSNMIAVTTKTWKWFDSSAGKWNTYSVPNNAIINNAFVNGERSVRITCGRQKYTINFNCMSQVNEATGNHRPIIPGLKITEVNDSGSKIESSVITSSTSSDSDSDSEDQCEIADRPEMSKQSAQVHSSLQKESDTSKSKSNATQLFDKYYGNKHKDDSESTVNKIILHEEPTGLQQYDTGAIVSCLVRLLRPKLAIDLETINSILKLCVRLTKEYENAKVFAQSGGIKLLLNMRQMCGYMGFPTYAILLIRHVLEEPSALLATMERVISTRTISAIPSGHRDIIFVLRQMSSAVARDPKIFIRAALNVLRLDNNMIKTKSDGLDDLRLIVKSSTFIKKSSLSTSQDADNTASCSSAYKTEYSVPVSVLNDLLKALVLPCSHFPSASDIRPMCEEQPSLTIGGIPATKNSYLATNAASIDKSQTDDSQGDQCCGWHIPSSSHLHDKPLLTRSTILKILADAVRSYQSFAPKLITEHVYVTNNSILVQRDQTALSFILDNFLPLKENSQDREVSTMARVLITSLSDCVDQLSIQNAVIAEVKAAIQRAVNLPECSQKHMRLQVLVGLLPSMIDNSSPINKIAPHRNEIFLILLRKGIMTDLAKMVLHLDLSNPSAVTTLNTVLKPMETLLRLTVAPGILLAKKKTSNLQSNRRNRDHPPTAVIGRSGSSSGRPLLSRRATNSLHEENIRGVIADRSRATGFFFTGDLARTGDQFNHIFDGILENDQGFFNGGVIMGRSNADRRSNEVSNENEGQVAETNFETSSESSDSESNASEDNEDRDVEEDDANEETTEDRSEADVDEETRQFIEVFDHVYAPDQSRTSQNVRNLDGVPIVRYTVTSNANAAETAANSVASTSAAGSMNSIGNSTVNDNRMPSLIHQGRQHRSANASVLSRSFNPIQHQQHPSINTGIIRSTPVVGSNAVAANANSNAIDDELIARFNYYIHHGQTLSNASGVASNSENSSNNATSASGALGPLNSVNLSSNAGIGANGIDSTEGRTSNSTARLQRDSRRLLFVDQQYCTPVSFNNAEESQNELFNQDALHWWLEEAKNLDMESQPNICLIVAHQIIPELKELRNKTIKRKRKTTPGAPQVSLSSEALVSGDGQETIAIVSPSFSLSTSANSVFNNSGGNSNNRRSAIPVLVTRNPDRDTHSSTDNDITAIANPNAQCIPTDLGIIRTLRRGRANHITRRSTRTQNPNISSVNSDEFLRTGESQSRTIHSDDESQTLHPFSEQLSEHVNQTEEIHRHSQETITIAEPGGVNFRQLLDSEIAEAALVPLPDDDGIEENEYDEDEEGDDNDDEHDNDDNEDDNDEEEEDEEEDLNVEDVIMDFDDEIQNVLSQFPSSVRPQDLVNESSTSSAFQRDEMITNRTSCVSSRIPASVENIPSISRTPTTNSLPSVSTSTSGINTTSSICTVSLAPRSSTSTVVSGTVVSVIPEISPEVREVLGDLQVPEGVDPSFLAALPTEMREEVIQEHLRAQRNRHRAQQSAIETEHESLIAVNPDFLAALPPNIQAEVLSQQRIEQRRQAAQAANPNDPVDAAEFFQNLQPSLRQAILTDMEDSQIASLPPDLVAEAQNLRRDWEHRNRQVLQDRLTNQTNSTPSLSGTATNPPRVPNIQSLRDRPSWHTNSIWYSSTSHTSSSAAIGEGHSQQQDQPVALALMENEGSLLDVDALSCLLLMLFLDDAKFNLIRLHRVIRHLCYHTGTREWIINSLIAIIKMADETDITRTDEKLISRPQNLTLRVDAALGYRSTVFLIKRGLEEFFQEESYCGEVGYAMRIHPQAAKMVCRNSLDILLTLAKHFPRDFVPFKKPPKYPQTCSTADLSTASPSKIHDKNSKKNDSSVWSTNKAKKPKIVHPNPSDVFFGHSITKTLLTMPKEEFFRRHPLRPPTVKRTPSIFDVLLKLDCSTNNLPPRYSSKEVASMFILNPQPIRAKMEFMSFENSPFSQLLSLLPAAVVKRSPQLTDKIVRLLASLGMELPKEDHIQPFSVENDPVYVAELAMLEKPASTDSSAVLSPVSSIKKSTRVIAVHDSDSEPEVVEDDDDDSGSDYSSQSIKRRKLSGKLGRSPSLYPSEIQQLQIAVEVLTTKSCSEEGLEYATELIVHLSQCSGRANAIVVHLVTRGILGLAELVRKQITDLMKEVKLHNIEAAKQNDSIISKTYLNTGRSGIINDRFTAAQVVISAPAKCKPTCELQLPSMEPLIAKSSSQTFFLRTLKVFMQVRDLIEYKALLTLREIEPLSEVICLDELWGTLSECLFDLEKTNDQHAVLILQPAVEAFFLIHASKRKPSAQAYNSSNQQRAAHSYTLNTSNRAATSSGAANTFEINLVEGLSPHTVAGINTEEESMTHESDDSTAIVSAPLASNSPVVSETYPSTSAAATAAIRVTEIQRRDQIKFLEFAEKHRTVLNQILRQSPVHLSDGPFSVLVDHTRILDFDVKRKYFRTELERMDEGVRREELTVNVRRITVFEDSFRELYRRGPEEWKNRFYIVFEDEEGQDAGGLLREWYVIISREIFNPMYALFCVSPGDRVTYMINPSSHANPNHLCYFKFVGRVIAKAIHDNKLLECYFTRSFYKHILGIQVKYTDMESQDYDFYKGLAYLMNNNISTLGYDLTFSTEVQEFGVTQVRDLTPNGRNIPVTEQNKFDYIRLVCQLKMSGSILQQLNAFLDGFYDIIPKRLISIFNEQELELLISGLPNVDIEDLKQNTEYHKYNSKSPQIQWFWRALRSFDQADRAKFLQFVTGTSKVPLQGFSALEGMNGIQKFQIHRDDRSTDRLPCAHTCFNQLDLPLYKSFEKLRTCLTKAIHECSEGFGFNQLDLPLYKSFEKLRTCLTKAIHECSEGFGFNQLDLPLYKSFEKLRTCLTKAIHECSEGFGFA